jgi:NhaP-type Na+/H+ or K+/H+ antiporter
MRRLLVFLGIVQHKRVLDGSGTIPRLRTFKRLNPFHPLTYIVILLSLIIGLFMFGFVGLWKEVNWKELKFQWL